MLARIERARLMEDRTRSEFVRQAIRVYLAQNVTEAAGALPDGDELREEGKLDQAVGKVKDAAGKVVDKVRDGIKDATDRI